MAGRISIGALTGALLTVAGLTAPIAAPAAERIELDRGGPAARVPDEVIVQFEPSSSATERAEARADAQVSNLEGLGSPGAKLLLIEDGASVAQTIRELEADPAIVRAEPNRIEQPAAVPNDPGFGNLWGLHNVGQAVNGAGGAPDADIDAVEAWDIERGSTNTVVAIMDSGIDLSHPDLAPVLWQNPGEVASNGVDDDGNGFVDDANGYDFVGTEDPRPLDDTGHGTHVAGTAAAAGDDGFGVTGVSQRASIMALRVCNIKGCTQSDQIQAINYAAENGAGVLNGSLGGFSSSENLTRRAAIFSHPQTLYVFASGNDGADADNTPAECGGASPCRDYPCAHAPTGSEIDNTLCVAATGQNDTAAGFSNTGAASVDLGAPGTNILSTSAEREHFTDTFATNNFTTRWDPNIPPDDFDWTRTNEAPLNPNFGITDSPAGANYAANTDYGTITTSIPVGAVSERGCDVILRRSIALAIGDSFRVALLHNGAEVDEHVFSPASNSGMLTQALPFSPPADAGNLQVRLRLVSIGPTVANGVHVDSVTLECGETPGDHNHEFKQGTSMAAPHVAGAAALVRSRNSELTTTEVRNLLLGSVDPNAGLSGVTTSGGRLNVGTAIARTPPTTAITGGPAEGQEVGARRGAAVRATPGARPTFSFSSSDPLATFQCSIDGVPFGVCPNPFQTAPLRAGPHSLAVRAVDPRGNADTTPVQRNFSVESVPPNTKITKGPKKRTEAEKATFRFRSTEPRSTFQCRIDKKKFRRCRSPKRYKNLDPKRHRFQVRAIDRVGNVDRSPAKKRWRIER